MISQFDSASDKTGVAGEVTRARWYRMRVLRAGSGATIAYGSPADPIDAYSGVTYENRRHGHVGIWITGSIVLEYTDDPADELESSGGSNAGGGGANTGITELDSGPIAVPAGVAPTQLIAPNSGRIRGVSIQNIGTTVVAIGKTASLSQTALAAAVAILNADTGANTGNGGTVDLDGWQGGVWAVNVGGGPGSVLVGAY